MCKIPIRIILPQSNFLQDYYKVRLLQDYESET